jgi:hypothetical protein
MKLEESADGVDAFYGKAVDVYLLPSCKLFQTESNAVIVG